MSETVEKENAVPVADDVEDKAAFLEKRPEGSANRCSFMCLTSTANIGRALTAAVAKASVYQCAGKPFADPKACVGPLAADLVEYLAGDVGGGDPGEGAAGALSDLHSAMEAWTTSKKSWLGSVGETFSKASQADAIDALKSAVFKGEGWKVSDRERVSRELLLRVRRTPSCLVSKRIRSFSNRGLLRPSHTLGPFPFPFAVRSRQARSLRGGFRNRGRAIRAQARLRVPSRAVPERGLRGGVWRERCGWPRRAVRV